MIEDLYNFITEDLWNGINVNRQPFYDERYFNIYLNIMKPPFFVVKPLNPEIFNSRKNEDNKTRVYQINKKKSPLFK